MIPDTRSAIATHAAWLAQAYQDARPHITKLVTLATAPMTHQELLAAAEAINRLHTNAFDLAIAIRHQAFQDAIADTKAANLDRIRSAYTTE